MPRIYVTINGKGGVGKTAATESVAYEDAAAGHDVLVVDADSDCCLTDALCSSVPVLTLYDVLTDSAQGIARAAVPYRGPAGHPLTMRGSLALVAGSPDIASAAGVFKSTAVRQPVPAFTSALPYAIAKDGGQWDSIYLDPGPNWDAITEAVLWAATGIIIPVTPEPMAIKALKRLLARVNTINQSRPTPARVLGVLMSKVQSDEQRALAGSLSTSLQASRIPVFRTIIPFSDAVWKASGELLPVGAYAPQDVAAAAYRALQAEIQGVLA